MTALRQFYDRYHRQNRRFSGVIRPGNFTYFYALPYLHKACMAALLGGQKAQQKQQPKTQPKEQSKVQPWAALEVLDVGCGVGSLSLYLAAQGAQVTGIDVSARAIKIAEYARQATGLSNAHFQVGRVELQPSQSKGKKKMKLYDVIVCSEVIEHIKDDHQFLQLLALQLKPTGRLYLSTPSNETVLFALGFYGNFDQRVGHLRRYSQVGLKYLLNSSGWKVSEFRGVEGPLRNILFTTPLGFIIKFIRGPLIPVFHWFDQISGWLFGMTDWQVVATKMKT